MRLNAKTAKEMCQNKFGLEFIEVSVKRRDGKSRILCGPGSLAQNENGDFKLKSYFKYSKKRYLETNTTTTSGELFKDSELFELQAKGINGDKWISSKVYLYGNETYPSLGRVIECDIDSFEFKEKTQPPPKEKKYFLTMMFIGKFRLPSNKFTDTPGGGKTRNQYFSETPVEIVKITNHDDHLIVNIDRNEIPSPNFHYIFVEALSIALGKICNPIYIRENRNGKVKISLKSPNTKLVTGEVLSTVPTSTPMDFDDLKMFFEKYLHTFNKRLNAFYVNWFKISKAWKSGLDNFGVVITTSIESVVGNEFKKIGATDKKLINAGLKALKIINELQIDDRIKKRIDGSISNLNHTSVKSALHALVKLRVIEESHTKNWTKLRNKSAHPKIIETSITQDMLDLSYCNLDLFYRLLLYKINYVNCMLNIAKKNWPKETVPWIKP